MSVLDSGNSPLSLKYKQECYPTVPVAWDIACLSNVKNNFIYNALNLVNWLLHLLSYQCSHYL